MQDLFGFKLEENKAPIDNTNINRLSVFCSDEQKSHILKHQKDVFKMYGVDNFSDYVIKKIYEDIENKKSV